VHVGWNPGGWGMVLLVPRLSVAILGGLRLARGYDWLFLVLLHGILGSIISLVLS